MSGSEKPTRSRRSQKESVSTLGFGGASGGGGIGGGGGGGGGTESGAPDDNSRRAEDGGKSKRRKVTPAARVGAATARATKSEPVNVYEREREVRAPIPHPPSPRNKRGS